jgi:transcriptional regulator GlxA family with amidase domain
MSVLALVHGNLAARVGLGEAATPCGLSKRHFATLFRQTMGLTAHVEQGWDSVSAL